MKPWLLGGLMLVLAACTQQSQEEFATVDGSRISIAAELTPALIDAEFILRMNGETAIRGRTKPFGGTSQNFSGAYRGVPVSARITSVQKFFSNYVIVDVFYRGQLIETLTI